MNYGLTHFRKAKSLFKDIMQCHSCKASWGCLLEQIGLYIKLMHQKRGKTKAECIFCAKLLNATTLGKPAKSPTRTQAFPNKTDSISCQILIKTIKGKGYILIREEMKHKFVFQRAKSNMVLTWKAMSSSIKWKAILHQCEERFMSSQTAVRNSFTPDLIHTNDSMHPKTKGYLKK